MTETVGPNPFARLENTYARLPDRFYASLPPTPVPQPRLIKLNRSLAELLGFEPDALETEDSVNVFAGNRVPEGSTPLAMAYAGHQFGGFVPQLGDGRALLIGEVVARDGIRRDIQLKGSGRTPFSRMGDGRAAVGPVLREYIVSEGMAALGIPTTRALAAVTTGQPVLRETAIPGAVLTRVARSHIRVGTFQYFAARVDVDGLRALADYAIDRHDPEAKNAANPYRAFLDAVVSRQASLIAQWLNVGFIHGVMNTDNTSIAGETIDYGPCAFLDEYDPMKVFSSIDLGGRYAYANQPQIAHWNLACLAQALLPLLADDEASAVEEAKEAIGTFPAQFQEAWLAGLRAKIGLRTCQDGDQELTDELLHLMAELRADFTLTFRRLADALTPGEASTSPLLQLSGNDRGRDQWLERWRKRLEQEGDEPLVVQRRMNATNPLYIPRNHRVEAALSAALSGDYRPFEEILTVVQNPFDEQQGKQMYAELPKPHEVVQQTFCGT